MIYKDCTCCGEDGEELADEYEGIRWFCHSCEVLMEEHDLDYEYDRFELEAIIFNRASDNREQQKRDKADSERAGVEHAIRYGY